MNLTKHAFLFLFCMLIVPAKAASIRNFENNFTQENNQIKYSAGLTYNRTIYVDAEGGDDSQDGLSSDRAIKSLDRLAEMKLTAGDEVLLKGGVKHAGTIELIDLNTSTAGENTTIHIGSYGNGKATLDFAGYPAGVLIKNSSNIIISDIKITANGSPNPDKYMLRTADTNTRDRIGVQIHNGWFDSSKEDPSTRNMYNLTISNVDFYDIFYYNENDENTPTNRPCRSWSEPSVNYGYAIKGYNQGPNTKVENLLVEDCTVRDVSNMGVQITGGGTSIFNNLKFTGCNFDKTGGPGYMFANCNNGVLERSRTYLSGSFDDPRKWGRGSGMWLMNCDGFLIQCNQFEGASGIGDSCGAHIDHGNRNVTIQYCLSRNNAGGFVEVLGKNRNCSYRYNVSIDDGWRNSQKNDPAQSAQYWDGTTALTLGTILSVSGYTGGDFIGPYQTYIYNNTVVSTDDREDGFINPFVFQVTTSAVGVYIANNIFYVPQQMYQGWSQHTTTQDGVKVINEKAFDFRKAYAVGSDFAVRDMTEAELEAFDIELKNNLFQLYNPKYPAAQNALPEIGIGYLDQKALGGDPQFVNVNGKMAEDLIPSNKSVVERGIKIEQLESDTTSYGLSPLSSDQAEGTPLGLEVKYDFWGHPITTPIVGACVVPEKMKTVSVNLNPNH